MQALQSLVLTIRFARRGSKSRAELQLRQKPVASWVLQVHSGFFLSTSEKPLPS